MHVRSAHEKDKINTKTEKVWYQFISWLINTSKEYIIDLSILISLFSLISEIRTLYSFWKITRECRNEPVWPAF